MREHYKDVPLNRLFDKNPYVDKTAVQVAMDNDILSMRQAFAESSIRVGSVDNLGYSREADRLSNEIQVLKSRIAEQDEVINKILRLITQ